MTRRLSAAVLCIVALVTLSAPVVLAGEQVVEVWRSPFGAPRSLSVNQADGSVWAATGASVMHLSREGTVLRQVDGFRWPSSVSVSPADGSCWVADTWQGEVIRLAPDGTEVVRVHGFQSPVFLSADSGDGSCWVTDHHGDEAGEVVRLAANGSELTRVGGFRNPVRVSANPTDASCWVADSGIWDKDEEAYLGGAVVLLAADGTELARYEGAPNPQWVGVYPEDGSCWVGNVAVVPEGGHAIRVSVDGSEMVRVPGFSYPYGGAVVVSDGSCWIADSNARRLVLLSSDGAELMRVDERELHRIALDRSDGSIWGTAVNDGSRLVRLASDGTELVSVGAFAYPGSVSVSPADGSCWVGDNGNSEVVRLLSDGTEALRLKVEGPPNVSVDIGSGSCWVAINSRGTVLRLGADGTELMRVEGLGYPYALSPNPVDASCWVGDHGLGEVVRLASNGAELLRVGGFASPVGLSVDPSDGSCWVADATLGEVVRLAADGTVELRVGGFVEPVRVAVSPTDGSCWVADRQQGIVVRLASNGTELVRVEGLNYPTALAVNPEDGSCWAGPGSGHVILHLAQDGTILWAGYGTRPGSISLNPADGSVWVADANHFQIVRLAVVGYGRPPASASYSDFDSGPSPFSSFASGPGAADTWRRALTGTPFAHSGVYAMSSEVEGQGITGLRLALPTEYPGPAEVVLRAWAYLDSRTVGNSSTFFGFQFDEDWPTAATGWEHMVGWEALSDAQSRYQLSGEALAVSRGLAAGGWRLVEIRYLRAAGRLVLYLGGEQVGEVDCPSVAGQSPTHVVLGALGENGAAAHRVYFDDVQLTLSDHGSSETHSFALPAGPVRVGQGQAAAYTLRYGNGYPVLGLGELTDTLPDRLYVGISLPSGYTLSQANPAPARVSGEMAVWELDLPAAGQAGSIDLQLTVRDGVAEATTDRLWAWATVDPGAADVDPPSPPEWSHPWGGDTWGWPQGVLVQRIEAGPAPDLWVRKRGPRFASPGDTMHYAITVGNSGNAAATDIIVRDLMPDVLGGGDRIVGNIAALLPDQTWCGLISAPLPWGVPGDTLVLNAAYVPTAAAEVDADNNLSEWRTTVLAAHDPNEIRVSPEGGVERGEQLVYTLECENVGAGTAYGVYATTVLDPNLDGSTVTVADPAQLRYDPVTRTVVWEVGTLHAGEGAETYFTVRVREDARRARPIVAQATVYFPSVPEETPTNVVVNVVHGSFPDVPWHHWAVLPVEQAVEYGIVQGYEDATYRPDLTVSRDMMAAYIARALAGGDEGMPPAPLVATFPDVPTSHWAHGYVEYVVAQRVVLGYDDGVYRPALVVDRAQMAVFVARARGWLGVDDDLATATALFPDVPDGHWAGAAIASCMDKGVVQGYDDGFYRPRAPVTRDQMAVYIARAFQLAM